MSDPLCYTHTHTRARAVQTHMMGSQQYDLWIVIAACGEHVSTLTADVCRPIYFFFPFRLFSFRTPLFLILTQLWVVAPKFSHFPTDFHSHIGWFLIFQAETTTPRYCFVSFLLPV